MAVRREYAFVVMSTSHSLALMCVSKCSSQQLAEALRACTNTDGASCVSVSGERAFVAG